MNSARDRQLRLGAKRPEPVARREAVLQPGPKGPGVGLVVTVERRFARVVPVDEADVGREDGRDPDREEGRARTGGRLAGDGRRHGGEAAQPEQKPGHGGDAAAIDVRHQAGSVKAR